jgi:hypothetical protein
MARRLKVAVAGADIGGLAAAALMAEAGHEVALFDQFDSPRAVGSGLMIQPMGLAVPALRDWVLVPVSLTPPNPRLIARIVAGSLVPPLASERF